MEKNIEDLIKKLISNDLSADEEKYLKEVAQTENDVAELLKMHKFLEDPENQFDLATEKDFEKMRAITINNIHRYNKHKTVFLSSGIFGRIIQPLRNPAFSFAAIVLMFFAGFYFNSNGEKDFVGNIKYTAQNSYDLKSSYDSPYIYSNASIKKQKEDNVTLSFDVTRHMEISGKNDDPLVKEVLAQSILNSDKLSQKLRNISDSENIMDPKIKEALIRTMLNDNNQIVRQKSMFSLMKYPSDKVIQKALLKVLSDDESVYMRLAAVDYLSNNNVDPAFIQGELRTLEDNNTAVNQRINQLKFEK